MLQVHCQFIATAHGSPAFKSKRVAPGETHTARGAAGEPDYNIASVCGAGRRYLECLRSWKTARSVSGEQETLYFVGIQRSGGAETTLSSSPEAPGELNQRNKSIRPFRLSQPSE